jgi:uncharacterized membrane protein required for colicin V production
MNWIDIVILILVGLSVVWGMKSGLVGAALYVIGIMVGWVISGRLSMLIGNTVGTSPSPWTGQSLDTTITVFVYLLIIGASLVITRSVIKLIKPGTILIDIATLGLNRMVGILLGFVIGIIFSSIFLTALTRFTYDFDVIGNIPGSSTVTSSNLVPIESIVAKVENTKSTLEKDLTQSTIAPYMVKIIRNMPANMFGLIPDEFMTSLDILNSKL